MALESCRECHKQVSEEARQCPHCGAPRPASTDSLGSRLAPYGRGLVLVVLLFLGANVWFRHHLAELAGGATPPQRSTTAGAVEVAYSLGAGAWLHARIYDRGQQGYIGRITSLDCPRPGPAYAPRCVEVEYASGRREWVSRESLAQSYRIAAAGRDSPAARP